MGADRYVMEKASRSKLKKKKTWKENYIKILSNHSQGTGHKTRITLKNSIKNIKSCLYFSNLLQEKKLHDASRGESFFFLEKGRHSHFTAQTEP